MAEIKVKYETAGSGCLVQLVGVLLLFVFPIGTIFGVALFFYGNRLSRKFRCSSCGNTLIDADVKICPTCKTDLENKLPWWQ